MMILKWFTLGITIFYGVLMILGSSVAFWKHTISKMLALSNIFVGVLTIVSAILLVKNPSMIMMLIGCLIAFHVLAVCNGLSLYGQINVRHHFLRFVFSSTIVLLLLIS